ncbi:hypothetical protein RhiirB3_420252, partial [Rhizophagus irregularis]
MTSFLHRKITFSDCANEQLLECFNSWIIGLSLRRALSNTSEKAKDPKDRRFALLAYFKTYCKAAC